MAPVKPAGVQKVRAARLQHQWEAEVEVKVERRSDSFFLSLNLNLSLPITLADFLNSLLVGLPPPPEDPEEHRDHDSREYQCKHFSRHRCTQRDTISPRRLSRMDL
jgi:hypothetical protein